MTLSCARRNIVITLYSNIGQTRGGGVRQSNAGHVQRLSSPQKGKVFRRFNRIPTGWLIDRRMKTGWH